MRDNTGGASHWSIALDRLIWRRAVVDALRNDTWAEWRTSDANIAQLHGFLQTLKQGPAASPERLHVLETVTEGMARAAASDEPLWCEPSEGTGVPQRDPVAPRRAGRVVVVADAACGSARLDALDLWKRLGALQMESETSADSLYMYIRPQPLTSRLVRISAPMKIYRGRIRGSNQPLVPDRRYGGDLRDTAALEAWVSRQD